MSEQVSPGLVQRYLRRIGLGSQPSPSRKGLIELIGAHLHHIPFENLDVYLQRGVSVDPGAAIDKIVEHNRGGWCFELNGAFATLLTSLGYQVRLLGAAVLLSGPNTIIDHLCLEVTVDEPFLVDVGFGDGPWLPLRLNSHEPQDGGPAPFVFVPGRQGTTLARSTGEGLTAQYRFRRVAHSIDDFAPASRRLYDDPTGSFRAGPVVTRLSGPDNDRITLTADRLRVTDGRDGTVVDTPITADRWPATLTRYFSFTDPSMSDPQTTKGGIER